LKPKRIVIVGGVAGGASAAARARRLCEPCEVIVFERGPHVSFANCGLPYFVGGEIAGQDNLLIQTPESLRARFNLDVRVNTEVVAIDRDRRLVKLRRRLGELPHDRELVVYCHSGQRSYFACRLLLQHGFRVRNLTGSWRTWTTAKS